MNDPMFFLASGVLQLLTAAFLGLLVGALLAEDALLIPYWRTLSPKSFYALHPTYGPLLYKFFAPLTIAGPSSALFSAALACAVSASGQWYSLATAVLSCLIIGIYVIYFKDTNDAFSKAAIAEDALAAELARWAAWHRRRTVIGVIAFVLALMAIYRP